MVLLLVSWVCYRKLHPPGHAATDTLVPGYSKGAPRKTTSRPYFVEDGLRGSLHKCSGLDGVDEDFVWNEGCSESHHQPAPSPWLPCLLTKKKALLTANHRRLNLEWTQRWQDLTMADWRHVIFNDQSTFQICPEGDRLGERRLPGEHFQQRYQAYRVQAGGSLQVW